MTKDKNPYAAQPGKGAGGDDHWAVQTAQNTEVNPPDERIPSGVNVELNRKEVAAAREQESDTDLKTTDGYTIDDSGQLNNFAVEPPMYYEKDGQRIEIQE